CLFGVRLVCLADLQPLAAAIYPLSLHDALPIYDEEATIAQVVADAYAGLEALSIPGEVAVSASGCTDRTAELAAQAGAKVIEARSEEHTSELQSRENLVCRRLLEKKTIARRNHP